MNILNRIIESIMCIILHHSIISKIILFIIFLITTSVILGLSIHFIPLTSIKSLFLLVHQSLYFAYGQPISSNSLSFFLSMGSHSHLELNLFISYPIFHSISAYQSIFILLFNNAQFMNLLIDQHSIPLPYSMIGLYVVVFYKFSF